MITVADCNNYKPLVFKKWDKQKIADLFEGFVNDGITITELAIKHDIPLPTVSWLITTYFFKTKSENTTVILLNSKV